MAKLKMHDEHYKYLKERVEAHKEELRRNRIHAISVNHSEQRIVWDAYWLVLPQPALGEWVRQTNYLNDANIESAMKKILKEVL